MDHFSWMSNAMATATFLNVNFSSIDWRVAFNQKPSPTENKMRRARTTASQTPVVPVIHGIMQFAHVVQHLMQATYQLSTESVPVFRLYFWAIESTRTGQLVTRLAKNLHFCNRKNANTISGDFFVDGQNNRENVNFTTVLSYAVQQYTIVNSKRLLHW